MNAHTTPDCDPNVGPEFTRSWCDCEPVHLCDYDCDRDDGCTSRPDAECVTASCAEHNGNATRVTILPMAPYIRQVAAPSGRAHRSRYTLSGQPFPLRAYTLTDIYVVPMGNA